MRIFLDILIDILAIAFALVSLGFVWAIGAAGCALSSKGNKALDTSENRGIVSSIAGEAGDDEYI